MKTGPRLHRLTQSQHVQAYVASVSVRATHERGDRKDGVIYGQTTS